MKKMMFAMCLAGVLSAQDPTEEQLKVAAFVKGVAAETKMEPLVIEGAVVMRVVAYASSDDASSVDEQMVVIPEGWQYFTHAVWPVSTYGEWKVHDLWADADEKNPQKMGAIHCKVEALPNWQGPSWVGVQMDVVLVPEKLAE